jgi:hypothetical protein
VPVVPNSPDNLFLFTILRFAHNTISETIFESEFVSVICCCLVFITLKSLQTILALSVAKVKDLFDLAMAAKIKINRLVIKLDFK